MFDTEFLHCTNTERSRRTIISQKMFKKMAKIAQFVRSQDKVQDRVPTEENPIQPKLKGMSKFKTTKGSPKFFKNYTNAS